MNQKGLVSILGAGPGHPDYLTLRGLRVLEKAEVILRDALLDKSFEELFPSEAEVIFVGKRSADHAMSQGDIQKLLIQKANEGKRVVRLKGGDPFIYGRGGEEVLALREAGIECEVIPGLSSLNAAAGLVGIPLTQRSVAREVLILEGRNLLENPDFDFEKIAGPETTVAIFMGSLSLEALARKFIENGIDENRPFALVENASMPGECLSLARLHEAASGQMKKKTEGPGIIYLGEVVATFHGEKLSAPRKPHANEASKLSEGVATAQKASLFPVFLNLKNRAVLVVGGGKVAFDKIRNFKGTEAVISVVAKKVAPDVMALFEKKEISFIDSIQEREVSEDDFSGKHLVIAATNDRETNAQLAEWARKKGILFNAVDDPENCDFFTGAVIDHGPVRISLSSEGGLPGLSSYLRKTLALLLPKSHGPLWTKLAALRRRLKGILPGSENRMNAMRSVMSDLEKKYFNLTEDKARGLAEDAAPENKKKSPPKHPISHPKSERNKSEKKEVHGV